MSKTTSIEKPNLTARGVRRLDFTEIPMVDFAPMLGDDPVARLETALQLRDACTNVGFFYLKNHGVPQEMIDGVFAIGREYFALPEEVKMRAHTKTSPNRNSGYSPLRDRGGSLYTCYDMGVEFSEDEQVVSAGLIKPCKCVWPDAELPEFERRMREYRSTVEALGRKLFKAFALALELPENSFDTMFSKPFGPLRINYYPPQDPMTENDDIGIHAHTDFQCFTFLAQDEVEGLQVKNGDGEWIAAPPVPGTYVVNVGDQMARWTNDIFSSTLHRVLNLSGRERMSVPLFFGTDFDAMIETLPTCITEDRPKKYEPIMAGQHVLTRTVEVYAKDMRDGEHRGEGL